MGLTDNPRKDEGYSMQATVQHIYRFLETLGIDQVHLVGHSRGGLPVGRIATDHPAMVKTVTIVDSNTIAPGDPGLSTPNLPPAGPPPTKESIRQELLRSSDTFHKEFVTDEYVEALLEVRSHPKIREAALRLELLRTRWVEKNFEKTRERPALRNNSGSGWWMYEVKDESLDRIRSGHLKVPTLIIWGRNDRTAPYQLGIDLFEVVSKSVDRAQLHIFNQCGHYPYHDYPEEFVNLLVSFIEGAKG
jgi:pimeloyl-ACP methyl ester carboxylesterase